MTLATNSSLCAVFHNNPQIILPVCRPYSVHYRHSAWFGDYMVCMWKTKYEQTISNRNPTQWQQSPTVKRSTAVGSTVLSSECTGRYEGVQSINYMQGGNRSTAI